MNYRDRHQFETIVERATARRIVGHPDAHVIRDCLLLGKEIPDRYLPGRMVMSLDPKDRAMLTNLRSDDLAKVRVNWSHCL